MKHLYPKSITTERLNILLSLTSISSANMIAAMEMHLVDGWPSGISARRNGVDAGNFSNALSTLEEKAVLVERYIETRIAHLLCE